MRIALCQIDPTVGDLRGNAEIIAEAARRAHAQGAQLAVFPELALTGYPPRDLLDRPRFVERAGETLQTLAGELPAELTALIGTVEAAPSSDRPDLYNVVAVVRDGRVQQLARKRLLPSYDVFDETRYFAPGEQSLCIDVAGVRVGITVCEDIWAEHGELAVERYAECPVRELAADGAQLIVNPAASPFTLHKREGRAELLSSVAREQGLPVVFVNQVGGNDELLFDGQSALFGRDGTLLARAPAFEAALWMVSLEEGGEVAPTAQTDAAAALDALAMGTRDYLSKTGHDRAVIGLSGGIDSALTAAIAVRALGADKVLGIAMPTRYSSQHSRDDARELAEQLGMPFREVPIDDFFGGYLEGLTPHLDALGPARPGDVTLENLQARIRGNVLMAVSNRLGHIVLTTGNKSEVAVGYCTLYGDMCGGLAVISDLPKTFVYEVSREVNRQAGRAVIPESTLTKPPSAELRPDQTDQDSLPDYDVLDAILERHVEDHQEAEEIIAAGFDPEVVRHVVRLVRINEYKRNQMAPGLIVTRKAFGPGRRYPLAQRYRGE